MLVVNLVPWSGLDFSRASGDVLDLPDDVAQARIDAGLAEPVTLSPTPSEAPTSRRGRRP